MDEAAHPNPHHLIDRLERWRRSYRQRHPLVRALVLICAVLVTIVGLLMVVLPGPALIVLPLGIFLLALEFGWAERLLHRLVAAGESAQKSRPAKVLFPSLLLAGILLLVLGPQIQL